MEIDIKKIARLSRLALSAEEEEKFTRDMQAIVTMAAQLPNLEEEDFPLEEQDAMPLREDAIEQSLSSEAILKNAPQSAEECFTVPKTVE